MGAKFKSKEDRFPGPSVLKATALASLLALFVMKVFIFQVFAAFLIGGVANPLYSLLLAYTNDYLSHEDMAAAFASLGTRRMIATRLDTARRIGGLLAAAGQGLAFGGAGASPVIADGLHELNPAALARLILNDPDADSGLNPNRKIA